MSRYAISDIHGCLKTFRYLVEEVIQLKHKDDLYLLGDYIDRGPDSKGVLDYIMASQKEGYSIHALCGNHEDMLLQAREDALYHTTWMLNGGKETLKSFQATSLQEIGPVYWAFFEKLDLFLELDDYLLVHAGFNFAAADPSSDRHTLLWARDFEVDPQKLGHRKVVHGHTPIPLEQMKTSLQTPVDSVLNIDGGCVFKSRLGYLAALNLDTLELKFTPNREEG
ncbi:metallophosphoesterase family protein [Rufibacter glacialis]|uniref:Metallophosphoesterase family protein n=1 Tax=Rufibacter glacialis TaxID=1259555 RepID=A0A5M8QAB8_9BACT|nr:metallophosphoesterase family protein [Rufibacter glacialis]KAA6431810.1 serine/threonine protein phosphatase [Rufibacter glacialis]GGK81387.1 serine/threonine protein phosphatase [Rufibacter glacialis]